MHRNVFLARECVFIIKLLYVPFQKVFHFENLSFLYPFRVYPPYPSDPFYYSSDLVVSSKSKSSNFFAKRVRTTQVEFATSQ